MFHILFTVHRSNPYALEVYRLSVDVPTRFLADRVAIERAEAFTAAFGFPVSYKVRKARS